MSPLLYVMVGGAVGSGARYLTGRAMTALLGAGYPFGTLAVNLVGGLLMGVLVGVLARHSAPEGWRLLLGDVVTMIERGAPGLALGYVLVSVIGSIAALFAGLSAVRAVA
jgi:CrcB protein